MHQGLRTTAESLTDGQFHVEGITCYTGRVSCNGFAEKNLLLPERHMFGVLLNGEFDEVTEESWDGRFISPKRRRTASDAILVPGGSHFISKTKGSFAFRNLRCEIEPAAFARVLGESFDALEFRGAAGMSPIVPGLAERLAAVALNPQAFPLAYTESLATILIVELAAAYADARIALPASGKIGSRFGPVIAYIEESLGREIGLFELALLARLSVTHFSHAFKLHYGISPYRYVLQRRIERAKLLLRTTDATVAAIATSVGFASQSSFGSAFARATGCTPSAYRDAHL